MPLLAATMLGISGYAAYLGLPMILGALADAKGITADQLGWIASAELAGVMAGSIVAARLLGRAGNLQLALPGIAIALVANLATPWLEGVEALVGVRAVAGIGGGLCYALALARLSAIGDPTRNSSLFGIGLVLMGSLELIGLPWLAAEFGLLAMFMLIVAALLLSAGLLPWLPNGGLPDERAAAPAPLESKLSQVGLICLFAIFVYNIGATSFWVYVERLGVNGGLASGLVGQILNVANLLSLLSCWFAYWIARRWGQHRPQVIALLATAAIVGLWPLATEALGFGVRTILYFQLLTVSQIYQLSVLGTIDRSGGLAALLPAAQGAGQAIGPLVGGAALLFGFGFRGQLVIEALLLAVTAGIYALGFIRLRRIDPTLVAAG